MTAMMGGYAVAACGFALLAASLAAHGRGRTAFTIAVACAVTAIWALTVAVQGTASPIAEVMEVARNAVWLVFLYLVARASGASPAIARAVRMFFFTLLLPLGLRILLILGSFWMQGMDELIAAVQPAQAVLAMLFAVGALTILHNLYTATAESARPVIGAPFAMLTLIWGLDLTVECVALAFGAEPYLLLVVQGWGLAALALLLSFHVRTERQWTIRISRTAAFRSLGLIAVVTYGVLILAVTALIRHYGFDDTRLTLIVAAVALIASAPFLAPAPMLRARIKRAIAQHFFAHRYDYRQEWLRFTETLGAEVDHGTPLERRVVKALADITESPSGMLLLPDAQNDLHPVTAWNRTLPEGRMTQGLARGLANGRVLALDPMRRARNPDPRAALVPEWLFSDANAWAVVPLIHFGKLTGVAVLDRPFLNRSIDWEDCDLLGVAGRQSASYLAEAAVREALTETQQFDEFNRRFAFVMHDIKNLVSQLTLMARNAQRHADNPAFRADMIATLNDATQRMGTMLAHLARHQPVRAEPPRCVPVSRIIEPVIAPRRAAHPIVVTGDTEIHLLADPERLETAFAHIVQNAIDASDPHEPVTILVSVRDSQVVLDVIDRGCGMTAEFVARQLFRPFVSSKESGFGIGAYEARALIQAMNGRIELLSQPGEGTRFRILLPMATPLAQTPSRFGAEKHDRDQGGAPWADTVSESKVA